MVRYEYTETEWQMLKVDLVAQLALNGIYRLKSKQIAELRGWFAEADFDVVPALVGGLASDDDSPARVRGQGRCGLAHRPGRDFAYLEARDTRLP